MKKLSVCMDHRKSKSVKLKDYISNLKVSYVSPKPDESNMKLRQVVRVY